MRNAVKHYHSVKQRMEEIIDQHMREALTQIEQEFGDIPAEVSLVIHEDHSKGVMEPASVYGGCSVALE